MKFHVYLFVFALLQLVVAIAEDEIENETSGLRGSLSQSIDAESGSNEDDRKLRPYGYPAPPRRPGQSQRYGLNSLLGYRPYTNTFQQPQGNFQQQGQFEGGRNRGFRGPRGNRRGPQGPRDVNGDGRPDGALIVGIPRNPTSLAERLGFLRIDQGTSNIFVQGGASAPRPDINAPTPAPEPTISPVPTGTPTPAPTRTPTLPPTRKPTEVPTRAPTKTPTLPPTKNPTQPPTKKPTREPTKKPTKEPTRKPTNKPTNAPSF